MNEKERKKALNVLLDMECAEDLKKAGFTLSDYREALRCAGRAGWQAGTTTYEAVAKWYKKQGFTVTEQGADGIGWTIC